MRLSTPHVGAGDFSPKTSRQAVSPIQFLGRNWSSIPDVKWSGSKGDHSPSSKAKAKNRWGYISTHLTFHHVLDAANVLIKQNYRMGSCGQPGKVLVRTMVAYEGEEIDLFLTSAIDGDEWPLYLQGYNPCNHWMRDWVGFRYGGGHLRRERSPSWAGIPTTTPGCPALIPITTPGPVHAVSSHVCATVYYIVSQTRLKYSEHERWVMMEMKYWKAVSAGFRTGTAMPELPYRNLALLFLSCIDYRKLKLFCVTHSLNITWSASTVECVATGVDTEGMAWRFSSYRHAGKFIPMQNTKTNFGVDI